MPVALVIFDCDGVLIDSEALCDRVVSADLSRQGWSLSPADCHRLFLGLTFPDIQSAAEAYLRRPLGIGWLEQIVRRVTEVMAAEADPVPGAREALEATTALGLPFRIASNSSRPEMAAKFARAGLSDLVEGRIHSAYDLIARGKRGKPDPDLFLEAAAAEPAAPEACVVIEDSLAGVQAAIAAGMTCLGYSPDGEGAHLRRAGAVPFGSMFALPNLLRGMLGGGRMTIGVLSDVYPWTKAFHVISMIAWMAATFYMPRLFVYHCDVRPGSAESERFKVMEYRLFRQIMNPAMIATWVFGIVLVLTPGVIDWSAGWWHVKLLCVILMSGFHGAMSRWRKDFLNDANRRSQKFYRIANEIPTVLMVVIVIMVIVRPF